MPIIKKPLYEQVYDDLKRRILTQEIAFGEKLVNRDLQEHYGVSSTPVRDAVYHLHRDGLVDQPTRSGARVITFDLKLALEINEVLSLLNVSAVQLSAERSDRKVVSLRLGQILDAQEENIENERYYDCDHGFHSTFFDYSHNAQLKKVYTQYHVLHEMLARCYHKSQNTRKLTVAEHRLIYETYSAGDVELACTCMRKHYEAAVAILRAVLR